MSRRDRLAILAAAPRRALRGVLATRVLTSIAQRCRRSAIVVLGYHDLREDRDPSSWLRVPVGLFREHLAYFARVGTFADPRETSVPARRLRFLLTFDDGYANNERLAVPALEASCAPALFFLSTHHLLTGEPFWFDRVVLPLQTTQVAEIDLRPLGMRLYRFAPEDGAKRWRDVQALLSDLKQRGNPGAAAVDLILEAIERRADGVPPDVADRLRPMRPDEFLKMSSHPLCHFASHGHRHEILTLLDDGALAASLARSRSEIETLLGRSVTDLAYPNGDHDDRVERAAREAGYRRAFAAHAGVWRARTNIHRIPRVLIGGYDSVKDVAVKINLALLRDLTSPSRGS